jgi:4-diphosphocytidyl-2-C-methyl-D-erythritol kinase
MPERLSHTRITLCLDIVRRLADGPLAGYHELAVVKHQIDLHDTIRVEDSDATTLTCNDPLVPTDESNLCVKAVRLLQREAGHTRQAAIDIEKRIPVMGGLAGGSANAATTLSLLNELWGLGMDPNTLASLGRELGMDVPFYFVGGTAIDSETGEPAVPLAGGMELDLVLVVPTFGVSTAEAYGGLDYDSIARCRHDTTALIDAWERGDRPGVLENVHNDFEQSVYERHPSLRAIRDALLVARCDAAFMSGSGSTLVGVARNRDHAESVQVLLEASDLPVARTILSRSLKP